MNREFQARTLGSTGLRVGLLGVAASYGAQAEAFEEAFEKGCNYFYLGSGRRRAGMKFVLSNPAVDVCLCGPKDTSRMRAAQSALELGPLGEEDMERVKMIGDHLHRTAKGFF